MKKLYYLLTTLIGIIILSCSSNDTSQKNDPIIGVWKPVMQLVPYTFDTIYFNECEQKSRYQFNADGTISQWKIHSLNSSNECFINTELISGNWVRTYDPSDSENTFFELTLLNNLTHSQYVANNHYDVGFYLNHDNLIWRTFSMSGSSGYLFLERVE